MESPDVFLLGQIRWQFFGTLKSNLGGGMARITLFDPRLNAAGYLTKTGQGSPDAGDHYESAKFGHDACHLMLSHGAKAILASLQLSGQKGRSALRRELSHE